MLFQTSTAQPFCVQCPRVMDPSILVHDDIPCRVTKKLDPKNTDIIERISILPRKYASSAPLRSAGRPWWCAGCRRVPHSHRDRKQATSPERAGNDDTSAVKSRDPSAPRITPISANATPPHHPAAATRLPFRHSQIGGFFRRRPPMFVHRSIPIPHCDIGKGATSAPKLQRNCFQPNRPTVASLAVGRMGGNISITSSASVGCSRNSN